MISLVAGTFNIIHEGHMKLLSKAFEVGDMVIVGITTDEMASKDRRNLTPIEIRKKELIDVLNSFGKPWEIIEIDDIYGPREKTDYTDIIVVSDETLKNAEKINRDRLSRGICPLKIAVVPLINAYDNEKISSTCVIEGRYSKKGRNDVQKIAVGSLNKIKIEAVRTVMEKIFEDIIITPVDVGSGVPEQPFGSETRRGAINRARSAIGDNDFSIGIEAGVFETEDGLYDFQYCAILDKEGLLTVGVGPGFKYPDEIASRLFDGRTVEEAVYEIYGNQDIGNKQGAVGLLSKGIIDRKTLTEQSVIAAMIPRMEKLQRCKEQSDIT